MNPALPLRVPLLAAALLALPGAHPAPPAAPAGPFPAARLLALPLDPTAVLTWSGATNQGPLTSATPDFHLEGSVVLALSVDEAGLSARITGARAAIVPGLFGAFGGLAGNPFTVTEALLTLGSEPFPVAADGSFRTVLQATFQGGALTATPPFGPSGFVALAGRELRPATVSGRLLRGPGGARLELPVELVFDFSLGGAGGTLTLAGTIEAGG